MSSLEPSVKLEIKNKAREVRLKYTESLLSSDVFDILNEESILIRNPFESKDKFSGFTTFIDGHMAVYLNSSFTLGHERFTAAHELYHVLFDKDVLIKNKLIVEDEENEEKAKLFAIEFLMPEDLIKAQFYKRVGNEDLQVKHVIRLHNYFKVSYRTMLKRLLELNLCTKDQFDEFEVIGFQENASKFQELTIKEGFNLDLITSSEISSIPQKFLDIVKDNYENGRISYGRFKSILEFINKTPDELGYKIPNEDIFL